MSPDLLIMSADIARVAAERPDLDEELVHALYQHLVLVQGRQPTVDELREYVERVSCLDQDTLRQRLGLAPRRARGRRLRLATSPPRGGATSTAAVALPSGPVVDGGAGKADDVDEPGHRRAHRRRGRPGWTPELFAARYQAARQRATRPYTDQSIASHLEMLDGETGTEPDYLRKLVKRFGVPARPAEEERADSGNLVASTPE